MNRLEGLAHDMRAPLAALEAASAQLSAHAEEPDAVRRAAGRVRTACVQLRELAEDMLTPEENERPALPCTLREILLEAYSLYEARVEVEMSGCCDAQMLADAPGLRRILINLLSNGIKFSPKGERVRLIAAAKRDESGVAVRILVSDQGVGMSAETLKYLFQPRVRGEESDGIPGYGLGLCGAQQLAKAMGAQITAQSRLGEGSTFAFEATFPAVKAKGLDGRRLLLAEDQDLVRDAGREMLEAHGAQVETAADGEVAVRCVLERPEGWFDAVLMDVMMPGMDGLEAARRIRTLKRGDARRLPIIALTGASSPEGIAQVKASGMDAHTVKPLRVGEIAWLLEQAEKSRK